uniref:CYTH domain-containing protein n=1 Tax=Meiothermus ruber TaxID=277 RepID=A0A7C3DKH7_MEIRU
MQVRDTDLGGFLTIKGPTKGIARSEFEYCIPRADAKAMLDQMAVSELEKTRHRVPFANHLWDVDVFHGHLEGLVTAEVELDRPDEDFERPPWLGREVSDDPRYANSALARARDAEGLIPIGQG